MIYMSIFSYYWAHGLLFFTFEWSSLAASYSKTLRSLDLKISFNKFHSISLWISKLVTNARILVL